MTHSKDIGEFREKFPELWEGHVYPNGGANLNRVNEMIEEWLTTKLTEVEARGEERGAEAERERILAALSQREGDIDGQIRLTQDGMPYKHALNGAKAEHAELKIIITTPNT